MEESLNLFDFVHNPFFTFSDRDKANFGEIIGYQFAPEAGATFDYTITYQSSFGTVYKTYSESGHASSATVGTTFDLGEFDTLPLPDAPKYYGGEISFHATYGSQHLDYAWTVIDHSQESGKTSSTSTGAENIIYFGNAASNTVRTGSGADYIDGGAGIDVMSGGAGNDVYYVTSGDRVYEKANHGNDLVVTEQSYALTPDQSIETLLGESTKQIKLTGNDLDQTIAADTVFGNGLLYGRGGHDVLIATGGADTLDGGAGADDMTGGNGNDTYVVDNVGDKVVETIGHGVDTIQASVSLTLAANVEKLNLIGTGAIHATGNALANTIVGNASANMIDGGLGNDILKGGSGLDTFVFSTALGPSNIDRITDFAVGKEQIHLDHDIFSTLMPGGLDALQFKDITHGAKADANDHILYNADKGALYYDADGSGAVKPNAFAVLDTHPIALSAHDFLIV